jgi:hypothetical protein
MERALCCVGEVPGCGFFWRVKLSLTTPSERLFYIFKKIIRVPEY